MIQCFIMRHGLFAASSDFNMVYGWCRANDRKLSFSAIAAKHMMTFGYLVDGATFVTEIKAFQAIVLVF